MITSRKLLVAALALVPASAVLAALEVENGYVRGLPPGVSNTAAYMTLHNPGADAVELVGGSAEVAGSVMLHTTIDREGMLHMEHLHSVSIPAGGSVVLESGAMHLMLMQLKRTPKAGERVAISLEFADGSTQQIDLPVRSVLDE